MNPRPTVAEAELAIEDSQAIMQGGAPELIARQEAKVLSSSIASFKQGALTDRDAAIALAVIANLREVQSALQKAVLRGQQAAEFLTGRK